MHSWIQIPQRLNRLLGPGDDDRVEAEKESGKGRCDGPEKEAGFHGCCSQNTF
jgi:hypothetical protein